MLTSVRGEDRPLISSVVDTVVNTAASVEPSAAELATEDPGLEAAEKTIAANTSGAVSQPNSRPLFISQEALDQFRAELPSDEAAAALWAAVGLAKTPAGPIIVEDNGRVIAILSSKEVLKAEFK